MSLLAPLRELNSTQRHTVLASFLGWTLDAFDYFLLTFVIVGVAAEFHVGKAEVTYGLFLTLAARPVGALLFGRLADRFAGGGPLATPWPHEVALSLDQRMDAQTALVRLGFSPGATDGMVGAGTRRALRAWQKQEGLPADGYLSPQMVERLKAAAARS